LATHCDRSDSGEASKMKKRDRSSAATIRRPEARLGGEAYVITKDAERACSVPGLRKALQSSLQRRRESAISGAVVGDKSVIDVVARRRRCKP